MLTSNHNPPVSTFPVAGIAGIHHDAQLKIIFKNLMSDEDIPT
jgi:hypothetical protein